MKRPQLTQKASTRIALVGAALSVIVGFGSLLPANARAATIFSEPFAYSTGNLPPQGTWSGSADWDVESGSLDYPTSWGSAMATGNQAAIDGGSGERVVNHSLGSGINFDAAGTYYVSFLFRKESTGVTSNEYLWLTLRDSTSYKASMGIGSNENVLVGRDQGTFGTSSNTILGDTDYFYVAKIVTAATGNDQYFARIYSPSDTLPMTEPGTWNATHLAAMTGTANQLRLAAGPAAFYTVDEIRIGTTWADVVPVPEPSTLAMLLGLAGVGLLALRRRSAKTRGPR